MNVPRFTRLGRARGPRPSGLALLTLAFGVGVAIPAPEARALEEFSAPNPWIVLRGNLPKPSPIDATAPCFPAEVLSRNPDLAQAGRAEMFVGLKELDQRIALGEAGDWDEPVRAILLARIAKDELQRDQAFDLLTALVRDFPEGRTRACFQLELGRIELFRGNYPEAAAWARRVEAYENGKGAAAGAIGDGAILLRAEALYLTGRRPQALALYRELEGSAETRLERAARLRAADLAVDAGRPEAALPRYDELLPKAVEFGASSGSWGARVGEAAFQSAQYASALAWFQRYAQQTGDSRERALAEIRVADSAAMIGKLPEARALLDDLVAHGADPATRDLARIRVSIPPVGSRVSNEELENLRRATESPNLRVAQYARAELGRAHLEAGEAYRALEVLTRVVFEAPDPRLAPWLDVHLAEAIEGATERAASEEGCRRVIEVIGWRRDFLLRRSVRAEPFLDLGRCYEEAGLPGQAIHLYRALVTQFGLDVNERVSLPLARAALGAGEVTVAKASAQINVEDGAGPEWALLLAQVMLAEGRDREALQTLRELLDTAPTSESAPQSVFARAIWHYAVLGLRLAEYEMIRPILASADRWLAPEHGLTEEARSDVFWVRAEARRRADLIAAARRDYEAALALLPPGPRRASAEYWLGVLEDDPERERHHYQAGTATKAGGLWGDLAGEELALSRMRERYGRPRELQE